jgi:uncharacterized protein YeaO (DUF488 family)
MTIQVKRVYDPQSRTDGYRVLVDRLWPRGLSKEKLQLDAWMKELAPSNELRKWFGHEAAKWAEFQRRYFKELKQQPELIAELRKRARGHKLTLLYGSREEVHNNAAALKKYLERKLR